MAYFTEATQQRQGVPIACGKEIAFREGWIGEAQVEAVPESLRNNDFGQYLADVVRRFRTGDELLDDRFGEERWRV